MRRRGIVGEDAVKRPTAQTKERRLGRGQQTQGHATRFPLVGKRFGSGVVTAGETALRIAGSDSRMTPMTKECGAVNRFGNVTGPDCNVRRSDIEQVRILPDPFWKEDNPSTGGGK